MGKQRKKVPVIPSKVEKGEGFTGFLMTLKVRPELQARPGSTDNKDRTAEKGKVTQ